MGVEVKPGRDVLTGVVVVRPTEVWGIDGLGVETDSDVVVSAEVAEVRLTVV